jgi:ubiquinone/menaquinone biosynthesis C-methylase UbiE
MMDEEKSHWTKKVFIEDADLFLPALRDRRGRAKDEVDGLNKIFNVQNVPVSGLVLNLACGIGRHDTFLVEKGYNILGLDISPEYIKLAKSRAKKVGVDENCSYVLGDMRKVGNMFREKTFDAIISIFTSLGYYDKDTDFEVLKQIREVCKTSGILVVDVMTKRYGERLDNRRIIHQIKNGVVRVEESEFDSEESKLEAKWIFYELKGHKLKLLHKISFRNILYSLEEFDDMLQRSGWDLIKSYSNFNLSQYTEDSKYMILVASV